MTPYIILFLFLISIILVLLEQYFEKYKTIIYLFLGFILIITAGLREVGVDPDSINYEQSFINYDKADMSDNIELSYIYLSTFVHLFSNDVHFLFLIFSFIGVSIKMLAFKRMSELIFLPMMVYISYYFTAHECMQIRTGVLSGIYLLIVKMLADNEKKKALFLLMIGVFFHVSALLILPFFLLSNKKITFRMKIFWASLIPLAYAFALAGFSILFNVLDLPIIGNKLELYQKANEIGKSVGYINIFAPRDILSIFIFYYLLIFHDTICQRNIYFPLMIKILAIGLFIYVAFSFFPVLAQRTYMLYNTVSILLISNIYYTIRPKWASIIVVAFISFIYLNYSLAFYEFYLIWKV